jgi:four helix bundle protein
LTLFVYRLSERFPAREKFGITSQIQRCAASPAANIAEGFGRRTMGELLQSLRIARGEVEETRYFLMLGKDLGFVPETDFQSGCEQCDAVGKLINASGTSLRRRAGATAERERRATTH